MAPLQCYSNISKTDLQTPICRTKKELSLRTSPLKWCGNPPTIKGGSEGRLSVFRRFRKIRGIATPVCALARNDSINSVNNNLPEKNISKNKRT